MCVHECTNSYSRLSLQFEVMHSEKNQPLGLSFIWT